MVTLLLIYAISHKYVYNIQVNYRFKNIAHKVDIRR